MKFQPLKAFDFSNKTLTACVKNKINCIFSSDTSNMKIHLYENSPRKVFGKHWKIINHLQFDRYNGKNNLSEVFGKVEMHGYLKIIYRANLKINF